MRSAADRYDWELRHVTLRTDQDVAFYRDLAGERDGGVLELACGTGRVGAPLAAAGCRVVGLDIDARMLAVARRRGVQVVVAADMRGFALRRRFSVVAIPYNSLQLLAGDLDVRACLRCALAHIDDDGVVAFELTDFVEDAGDAFADMELLASAEGMSMWGAVRHQGDVPVTTYTRRFEEEGVIHDDAIVLRSFRPGEVAQLVQDAGGVVVRHVVEGTRTFWVACRA